MDGLDLLKKDWNKDTGPANRLSVNEIYPMLHKKSSSIVKTLFYISIGELFFWIAINSIPYFCSKTYRENFETTYSNNLTYMAFTLLGFAVILLFIGLLYRSYKSISVTDSAKKLMENILSTRNVIKYYVLYNLIVTGIFLAYELYNAINNDPNISYKINNFNSGQMLVAIVVVIAFVATFIVIIWLFYLLIYGLLLKRLNRNYAELKRIENL